MTPEHRPTGPDSWEALLSDFLDDELPPAERRQVEDHLRTCASCAAVLEELRAVVARAGTFARESQPAGDLWAGIRPRLRPRSRTAWSRGLAALRSAGPGTAWRRTPAFAAIAVVLAGVALLLLMQGGKAPGPGGVAEQQAARRAGDRAVLPGAALAALEGGREYSDTVAELRSVVERRLTHDPRVVEVLDENLAAIEAAIAGYRDALAESPGDEALQKRLRQARERKVQVLRQAAALAAEADN